MKPPYVFDPNDPLPGRERQILTSAPVAGSAIPPGLFKRDEQTWIRGWISDIMSKPDQSVRRG